MTEIRELAINNAVVAAGASIAAAAPTIVRPFYETPEWMGALAVLGMSVLLLTAINAVFVLRKNLKGKDNG